MALRIASLQASDALRYRDLMLQAYDVAADAFTSTRDERVAEPEAFWVKRVADPAGLGAGFGAFDGDDLVGAAALEFSAKPKTRHKAHVLGMYVAPAARGDGVGRGLLALLVEHAQAREELHLLTLTVTEGNAPAINLYQSVGFKAFGVEPMAIRTPGGFKAKVHMGLLLQRRR